MNYMLDTNICIYIINNKPQSVLKKFMLLNQDDLVSISAISVTELFYGLQKSKSNKKEQNKNALIEFLTPLEIISYDESSAIEYGYIRANLQKQGTIISANDMLIASHALSLDFTLVTNNIKEFQRVEKLKLENWT